MAKKINPDEIQQLIDMGKEKGFLTYDEVNDMLPANMVSSEQLEDVMSMFGEMDIEIVESESKASNSKGDSEEDEREVELEAGTLGRTSDPVRMYLREMGQVALLTREGEVEIAKRIEEGEAQVTKVVMRTPIAAEAVIALLARLEKGQARVSDITRDYDEEEGVDAEGKQRERLIELYGKICTLDQQLHEINESLLADPAKKKRQKLEEQETEV
ncbi:MAG: RNA polymerase sigma factor RpoD, partial [Desulfuromusa sp.]|nr:RNA polymerase sigma factor RpoD [Desulfuromusa sp.]